MLAMTAVIVDYAFKMWF